MEKYTKKDIAITFENFIQYQSLKHGIDYLIEKKISVDIYVPINNMGSGFGDMYNDIYEHLKANGYNVYRKSDGKVSYKILLEPYPMDAYFNFNYEYRLKYKYGLSAKPDPVYKPEWNIYYDGILVNGKYETEFFNVYAKPHIIGNLKYVNYKKEKNSKDKKVLLYLPTYGDLSSIEKVSDALLELKKDYKIITKLHHGTSFLKNESGRKDYIKDCSDEIYDQHTPLIELLSKASVVLSDNSGAVFEAICANVPVCIYAQDMKKCTLGEFTSLQSDLVDEGIIAYTNDSNKIKDIVNKTLKEDYYKKQSEIRSHLFSIDNDKLLDNFYNVINEYLNLTEKSKYKKMHDNLVSDYKEKINNIKQKQEMINEKDEAISRFIKEIERLKNENIMLNEKLAQSNKTLEEKIEILEKNMKVLEENERIINIYQKGKLYKLAEKTYKITNKLKKRK